jgi:hypothetical protein
MISSPLALLIERTRGLQNTAKRLHQAIPVKLVSRLWQLLRMVAVCLAVVGVYLAWTEFPRDLQIEPLFFLLAGVVFAVGFVMHLFGWHNLTRIFFHQGRLVENAEAVAGSNLVKYLPTIVWYIANRSHYYKRYGIAQRQVVVASLTELILMAVLAGLLLISWWVGQTFSILMAGVALLIGGAMLIWLLVHYSDVASVRYWIAAVLWYGGSWPIGILILWLSMRAFGSLELADFIPLARIWLLTGLTSYLLNLTFGAIGIVREITLTVMLTQQWSLAIAVAAAITVKLVLTIGELVCSLMLLGGLKLRRRWLARLEAQRAEHEPTAPG